MRRRRRSIRWQSRTVAHDGALLSVRDTGQDAPVVVLLTGLGTSQRAWDPVGQRLGDRYRLITYDYRGHGRSSVAPSYTFDAFLEDLHAVLQDTSAPDPLLCGWSLGADLAIWYAAEHSHATAGVVALDGGIPAESVPVNRDQLRRKMNAPLSRALGRLMAMTGAGVHLSTDELLAISEETDQRRAEILHAYARLQVPVTVALGSKPTRSPDGDRSLQLWRAGAQKLHEANPGMRPIWLDSDHAIPLRCPGQVADLIDTATAHP